MEIKVKKKLLDSVHKNMCMLRSVLQYCIDELCTNIKHLDKKGKKNLKDIDKIIKIKQVMITTNHGDFKVTEIVLIH